MLQDTSPSYVAQNFEGKEQQMKTGEYFLVRNYEARDHD